MVLVASKLDHLVLVVVVSHADGTVQYIGAVWPLLELLHCLLTSFLHAFQQL